MMGSKYIEDINEEAMDAWIGALRSGEYAQTRRALAEGGGFCCLGVQAAVCGVTEMDSDGFGLLYNNVQYGYLPPRHVIDALNLPEKHTGNRHDRTGTVYVEATADEISKGLSEDRDKVTSVTVLNDHLYLSFHEIADRLEATFLRKEETK